MIYRLEEKFDIKFPQENLSPIYSGFLMNRRNGIKLSDDEINSIAASYPHLNINRLRVDRTVNSLKDSLTVINLKDYHDLLDFIYIEFKSSYWDTFLV